MDLATVKPETQRVDIHHPGTGAPTGLSFEVTSGEADAVKRINRKQIDKRLRSRSKKLTAAEIEADNIERISAAVVGWEWKDEASWGGDKLKFTKENVATVLATDWVRSQVQEVVEDEAAFFSN